MECVCIHPKLGVHAGIEVPRELGSPGLHSIDLVWPTVTSELEVHFPKCLQEKQDHDFAALSPKTLAIKQGLFPDHVFIH